MKKLALTFTILSAACAFTFAGAPESYKQQQQIEVPPSCAQFGGFDIAVDVGGGYHSWTWDDRDAWVDDFGNDWALGGVSKDRTGVVLGCSLGYTWQKNCTIFGFQIDGNWTSIDGSSLYTPDSDPDATRLTLHEDVNFFGTARTRTGIVMDNLLLYVTGGFAFADIDHSYTIHDNGETPNMERFSADSFRWGGCAGAGTEWAINRHWSLRTEILFAYFTDENHSGFSPNGDQNVHFDNQDWMAVSRFAFVYRFGSGK